MCAEASSIFIQNCTYLRLITPWHPGAAGSPLTVTLLPRLGRLGFCSLAAEQKQLRKMQIKRERRREGGTQGRRQLACDCCGRRIWALIKCSWGKKKKRNEIRGLPAMTVWWKCQRNLSLQSAFQKSVCKIFRRTRGTVNERAQWVVQEFYRATLLAPNFEDRYVFQHVRF